MMTIDEKAKAYDEALEKIKVLQEDWKSTHNRAWKEIEEVFPQLAESEDERIIKGLENFLWCIANGGMNEIGTMPSAEMCQKWLAYLEKQKEQKPKIIIPKFRIGEYIKPKPYNEKHLIKSINEKGYVLDVDFVVPFKDEDVWEVVEQKSAGWSEEDEKFIKELCNLLASIAKNDYVGRYYAPDLVNKLQSLHPQPNQEWSEEDERVKQELIYFFTHDTTEWFPKRRVSVASVVKFLKSLRPSWTPTEEEMSALEVASRALTLSDTTKHNLKTLYERFLNQ